MQSEGFTTKPSILHRSSISNSLNEPIFALDRENLKSIDELAGQQSLIYKVRLEFSPL